jgi:large subunit ribosomal protein L30
MSDKLTAVIRIKGDVKIKKEIKETFFRMRLRRKYACVVFNPTKEDLGRIKSLKDLIAYGEIDKETFIKLVEKRGQLIDKNKKINLKKSAEELFTNLGKKKYEDFNLKPFFRLHPPRGGIDTKKHFGVKKGVLGNHKDKINKLIEKML